MPVFVSPPSQCLTRSNFSKNFHLFRFADRYRFQGSIANSSESKFTKVLKNLNENLFSSGLRSGTRFGKRFSFDNIGWRQLTSGILDADIKISSKSRTFRCLHFKHSRPLHSHTNFKIRKSLFPSSNPSYSKMRPKTPSTIGSIVQNK